MNKILLAFEDGVISHEQQREVRRLAPDLPLVQTADKEFIENIVGEIEIAVGNFPYDLLPEAKKLRWFQQWSAGADWLLDHPAVQDLPFVLTNASGVHAIPISEHILAVLLSFGRNLPQAWRAQQQRVWMQEGSAEQENGQQGDLRHYTREDTFEVAGKTMLLIGVGEIGERTAKIAQALEMEVIALRHNPDHESPAVDETVGADELLEVLPKADVVVSTVPLTKATHHMLDERAFAAMKDGALLINIGRGPTVDEQALIAALQSGKLGGAGLDVFEHEPLGADSPLWQMDNVIITPHSSGVTPHYNDRAFALFLANLERYLAGEQLDNVVDKKQGY